MLDRLERADRAAELATLLHVVERQVERRVDDAGLLAGQDGQRVQQGPLESALRAVAHRDDAAADASQLHLGQAPGLVQRGERRDLRVGGGLRAPLSVSDRPPSAPGR